MPHRLLKVNITGIWVITIADAGNAILRQELLQKISILIQCEEPEEMIVWDVMYLMM